ncbi:hypothetical protein B0H63DRAFT_510493 [Podospora didyma]|uniref:Uncharacterized protein n=1 Tax=Podospora didyma TaxID=330526 RepID=A0AAE0NQG2_9PEZI|nr:hypothetical protein B0H63DRAFT_510493 [Podospora didyma]
MAKLWLAGLTALDLVANFVFMLGCISPGTKDLALYRVNATELAVGLQKLAFNDSRPADELLHPDLPVHWYWGMSAIPQFQLNLTPSFHCICDIYATKDETRCRRTFPPTQNILTIVEESLRDRLGSNQEQAIRNVVSTWNSTLNNISPSMLRDKEAKFAAQSKASAALVIIAVVFDFAILILALAFLSGRVDPRVYLAPFASGLLAVGAGTLAVLSMNDGVHGAVPSGENGGAGIIILFVGAALSLISCIGSASDKARLSIEEIGFLGERYIFKLFESEISDWTYEKWTSHLRENDGHPAFLEPEWKYADFTYHDHSGKMREVLRQLGVHVMPNWSNTATYHLEVKSTLGECDAAPMIVSQYQKDKMEDLDYDCDNVYILIRVFNAKRKRPGVRYFPNPWSLGLRGKLYFAQQNSDGKYPVWAKC